MTLQELSETVSDAIGDRRIGRPVAVRLYAYLSPDHGELLRGTADALALADRWLPGELVRLEARGSVELGHVTVLAEFSGGETALVSGACLHDGPPRIDFLILGTQGSVRHEGLPNAASDPLVLGEDRLAADSLRADLQKALENQ